MCARSTAGTSDYSLVASVTTPSFGVHVNFAAGTGNSAGNPVAPIPQGYVQDIGNLYGDQGNGLTYGWDRNIVADGRYRQFANSPDLRYDTFMHMIKSGSARNLECRCSEWFLSRPYRRWRPAKS